MSLNRLTDNVGNRLTDDQGNYLCVLENLFSGNFGGKRREAPKPKVPTLDELREEDKRSHLAMIETRDALLRQEWDDIARLLLMC